MSKPPIPPAIKFVLATMVINAMGFGIIMPVVPRLLMELSSAPIDQATAIGGYLALTFAVAQFVFSPILGNLSDRFGRRPILLGSLAGFSIDFFVLALAPTLAWVFIARALSGMFGASNGPAQSVIADIAAPEDRSRYFGLLGAAFGIGFVLGPLLGGLLGDLDHRAPFYVAGVLAVVNVVYGYYNLPETLAPENRRAFNWRRANPVGALLQVRKLRGILPISIVYFFWQLATLIYPLTWSYFTIGRYGWPSWLIGTSLAFVGISMAAFQILLLPRMVTRFGERKTAIIGVSGAILAMIGYSAANQGWMALAILPFMGFQSLVQPNLTAMITRRADATTQGEVQGFASAIMALGSISAPLVYNPALAWFTGPSAPFLFYGIAFIIAATIAGVALTLLLLIRPTQAADPATA